MSPSEINENPVQGEFFSTDLPKRFVRESVQNALDARLQNGRRDAGPVRVRFFLGGKERALDAKRAAGYLDGLRPHFRAVVDAENARGPRKKELDARKELFDGPMPFLVVQDFGTTGLRGDVEANEPEAKGNDFWGLFRSVGISPKGQDAGGSWGLGKWVFPDASRLNAFVGVTRRRGEDRLLLMGQAMLRLHKMHGKKYSHYGYFASASEEPDERWLPMPVDSRGPDSRGGAGAFVRRAVDDFGLRDSKSGTSVVVLHPEKELTDPGKLAWAVVTQYFWPIVAGDLVVEIDPPGVRTRVVDARTISTEVHQCGNAPGKGEEEPGALARAIELAKWALEAEREHVDADGARKKSAISPLEVQRLRKRYEKGDRLAFRVTTKVGGTLARFNVFLERDDNLRRGQDFFVRGHLHIPDMDYIEGFRARALTFVPSRRNMLGHLLRDAEGPAHERWSPSAPRLKKKGWPAAPERVREAQRAAERILEQLAVRPEEKQRDVFADLFPSKTKGGPAKTTRPPAAPDHGPDQSHGEESGRPSLRAKPVSGGFALDAGPNGNAGGAWTVRMAYDVARGTARTAFSRFAVGLKAGCPDFSLRENRLAVEHEDCTYEVLSDNELCVRVDGPDFAFKVTGFDERDLLVEIAEVGLDAGPGER